jgi:hypothetical protein
MDEKNQSSNDDWQAIHERIEAEPFNRSERSRRELHAGESAP